MRMVICILSIVALGQVGTVSAQLASVNEIGLSIGHLHLAAPDREKEAKAWLALGGQLENNLSANIPIGFPGVVVLLQQRQVKGGSAGSLIDHVAFRVPDLQASLTRWKGIETWWKLANWGLTIEPGTKPGQAIGRSPWLQPVHVENARNLIGRIRDVRIAQVLSNSLKGELVVQNANAMAGSS